MKYHVEFRYHEDTGEIEMIRVEASENGLRDADHDSRHDAVARDLADVLEVDADIEEVTDAAPVRGERRRVVPDEIPVAETRVNEL